MNIKAFFAKIKITNHARSHYINQKLPFFPKTKNLVTLKIMIKQKKSKPLRETFNQIKNKEYVIQSNY